jgi:hypothetical protein
MISPLLPPPSLAPPALSQTNCVKSNPMVHHGNYLVSVENDTDDRSKCDGYTDPIHPIPGHQYVLLKSSEISESVTENPLLDQTSTLLN